jgi:hypothetical protein
MAYLNYNINEVILSYGNEKIITSPTIILTDTIVETIFVFESINDNTLIKNNKNIILNNNGSIYIKSELDIGIYILIINCCINNTINIQTNLKIIIKPSIFYKINSFCFNSPTSIYRPIIFPIDIPISNFELKSDENSIIFNNKTGEISFNDKIEVKNYRLHISCTYKEIISETIVTFNIFPEFIYDYVDNNVFINHLSNYISKNPLINPPGGIFLLSDDYLGFNIDKDLGSIYINNARAGIIIISVDYKLNDIYVQSKLNFYIKPIIKYPKLIIDYGNIIKSEIPYCSEFDGIFEIKKYNKSDINNKLSIDKKTGVINIDNIIDIGNYKIDIKYILYDYEVPVIFELKINPIFYYKNNYTELIYGYKTQSEAPITSDFNKGLFFILNPIENIFINPKSGIIYFDVIIEVGEYDLDINYSINEINKTTTYKLIVKPKIEIFDNKQNINISDELKDILIYTTPNGGILYNDLNLQIHNNILKLSTFNKEINDYCVNITYEINNIKSSLQYFFKIIPSYIYKNNIINIIYNEKFSSEKPTIYPLGGKFKGILPENIIIDEDTGIVNIIKKIKIGTYNLELFYNFNNINISCMFIINIIPKFEYSNNSLLIEYNICDKNFIESIKPNVNPNDGIFICDFNKININNHGQLIIPTNLNIDEYNIKIKYIFNNITAETTFYFKIIQRTLNVIFISVDKIYDGKLESPIKYKYKYELSYELSYEAFFDTIYVEKNKILNINNINIIDPELNKYYIINNVKIKSNIVPLLLKINFKCIDKKYDGTTKANIEYEIINKIESDEIYIDSYNAYYENNTVGNKKIIINNIKLAGTEVLNYKCANSYEISGNILKKSLICNLLCINKKFNSNTKATLYLNEFKGIINNDFVLFDYCDAEYNDMNVNENILISVLYIKLKGRDCFNYDPICNTEIYGSILEKEIDPIVICLDKIYDNTTKANLDFTTDNYNIISYDANYSDYNIGTNKAILITNIITDNKNYFIKNKNIFGNILPKIIDIEIIGENKEYNSKNDIICSSNLIGIHENDNELIKLNFESYIKNINHGENKDILILNSKLVGKNSKNYIIGNIKTNKPTIYKKKISIEFVGINKIYDGKINATVKIKNILNTIKTDKISIKSFNANFEDKNIGDNKKILITNIVIDNNNNLNYYVEDTYTFANIMCKDIIIIINAKNKIYDGTKKAEIVIETIKGIYFNDNIFVQNYDAEFEDFNCGLNKNIVVNNFILGGIDSNNYIFTKTLKIKANIDKKKIDIEFFDYVKYYNQLTSINLNYKLTNICNNDEITIKNYNANFNNPNIGKNKNITINKIILDGNNNKNYYVDDYIIYGEILPIEPNIIWNCKTKIFNNNNDAQITHNMKFNINFEAYFSDINVGSDKQIFIKILETNINNYILKNEYIFYGCIIPQELILPIISQNKIYDDTINYTVIFDTSLNIVDYTAYFENKNIGKNKKVFINNIKLDTINYICKDIIIFTNIEPKPIIINDIIIETKIFDETNKAIIQTYVIENNLDIKIISYDAIFETINSGKNKVLITNIILSNKNYISNELIETYGEILPHEIIINCTLDDKIYDGTTNIEIKKYTILKKRNLKFDIIEIIGYEANFINENVGINKIVNIKNIKLSNNNYFCKDFNMEGEIKPKELSINCINIEKEYDGTTDTYLKIESIKGIINNNLIYIDNFNSTYKSKNCGIVIINIDNITLKSNNLFNYFIKNLEIKGLIKKRNINYTAHCIHKKYDGNNIANINIVMNNIIEGDDIYINNYTALYNDNKIDNDKEIIIKNIVLNGKSKNNYIIDSKIILYGNII